jgi:hypothetical protein
MNRKRGRPRRYNTDVVRALRIAWEATDRLCSKRLQPFLPELVKILRRTLIRGFSKFIEKNGSSGRLRPVDLMPARQE